MSDPTPGSEASGAAKRCPPCVNSNVCQGLDRCMYEEPVGTPGTASPAERSLRAVMLNAPLSEKERAALIEFTGPEHCDACRLGSEDVCSYCATKLRWEATVRALSASPASETATIAQDASEAEQITKSLEGAADHWEREVETLYGDAKP